jgi:ketosteroid isomerase-like protein
MSDIAVDTESRNIETVRRYLSAIESRVEPEELATFFHPDVVQEEFPNRLMEKGARRDLAGLLEASVRGRKVMTGERYEIVNITAGEKIVMYEALWSGTLAVAFATFSPGDVMRAHIASVVEFRDGKIIAQRSYDCFEPW